MTKEKTTQEKTLTIKRFIKEAFYIDGDVKIVHKPIRYSCFIECRDSTRGIMRISISNQKDDEQETENG
jgi:hypothetical protein